MRPRTPWIRRMALTPRSARASTAQPCRSSPTCSQRPSSLRRNACWEDVSSAGLVLRGVQTDPGGPERGKPSGYPSGKCGRSGSPTGLGHALPTGRRHGAEGSVHLHVPVGVDGASATLEQGERLRGEGPQRRFIALQVVGPDLLTGRAMDPEACESCDSTSSSTHSARPGC